MRKRIDTPAGGMDLVILRYGTGPGILWIHGGGYVTGMAAMVHYSMGKMLAKRFSGIVVSPEYRLAGTSPYPAALEDCWEALKYMYEHAHELGFDPQRLIVGGESAGGGLAAALCMYARDREGIPVKFQIPLYPMLDCEDTSSSRDNHAWVWNTKRNHRAWKKYLGEMRGASSVPPYASPSRQTDYRGLPPCYTYVTDGEPFLDETLKYVEELTKAGIEAKADVFHGRMHAFDALFWTKNAREARKRLIEEAQKYMV
ncbi:MAG: alpha/beta hydrolase [Eubacteriales bacterium]|nr:alpha/beta hydrolase [Eubacteriales bacterium]